MLWEYCNDKIRLIMSSRICFQYDVPNFNKLPVGYTKKDVLGILSFNPTTKKLDGLKRIRNKITRFRLKDPHHLDEINQIAEEFERDAPGLLYMYTEDYPRIIYPRPADDDIEVKWCRKGVYWWKDGGVSIMHRYLRAKKHQILHDRHPPFKIVSHWEHAESTMDYEQVMWVCPKCGEMIFRLFWPDGSISDEKMRTGISAHVCQRRQGGAFHG